VKSKKALSREVDFAISDPEARKVSSVFIYNKAQWEAILLALQGGGCSLSELPSEFGYSLLLAANTYLNDLPRYRPSAAHAEVFRGQARAATAFRATLVEAKNGWDDDWKSVSELDFGQKFNGLAIV